MNVTEEVSALLNAILDLAEERGYELITPELLILALCEDENFIESFILCGGDIDRLKVRLEAYLLENVDVVEKGQGQAEMSVGMLQILNGAAAQAMSCGKTAIALTHILHALWKLTDCYAVYYMEEQGVDELTLLNELIGDDENPDVDWEEMLNAEHSEAAEDDGTAETKKGLHSFAPCLNESLGEMNPLIGREEELERTIQILCRKDKNNPLHIGEPGVGKTALTYGFVQRLREGRVPEAIQGAKVYSLDLGSILAGSQYRGDFEKRLKQVLEEVAKEEKPIIYIDEIHNLLGAGATGEGAFDAANILKPYMSQGKIRFIGATTYEEYKKYFERSRSLVRRFQNVEIREPDREEAVHILEGLREKYEHFHGVHYADGVMEYAVRMSAQYINERFLPDKAIDLIDEAAAWRKLHPLDEEEQTVGKDLIDEVLTKICRVPKQTVELDEAEKLSTLQARMLSQIFGQDAAVTQVVNAVKYARAGLKEEGKPLASLLFVGPTGVGKTEIARVLAKELGVSLIRFDMSEYGERHSVAKLIGAPAGYVGYEEGGLLTEAIRKTPSAVLLLDEIEKAHPDIFATLLQVMDYATLTDNQGRKADFRNVILIMTSNVGAAGLGKTGIGFASGDNMEDTLTAEVRRVFQPEFRNRLSKVIPFRRLDDDMAARIAAKKLSELGELLAAKQITLTVDETAVTLLKTRGTSREYGAREIGRVIENEIKPLLVDEILFGKLKDGGACLLKAAEGHFTAEFAEA